MRVWLRAVGVAAMLLAAVAASALRFGRAFLVQFFINPFQLFIVLPWLFSFYCVWKGYLPLKNGGRIERAVDPRNYWIGVGGYAVVGTLFLFINLLLAWQVLSRPR